MVDSMSFSTSVFLTLQDPQEPLLYCARTPGADRMEAAAGLTPDEVEGMDDSETEMEGQAYPVPFEEQEDQDYEEGSSDDSGDSPQLFQSPAPAATSSSSPAALSSSGKVPCRASSVPPVHHSPAVVIGACGKKRGTTVHCDERLITQLIPFGTKTFNREVKALGLDQAEITELKAARRKLKNAKNAQGRRSRQGKLLAKLQETLKDLETSNTRLETTNAELRRAVQAAEAENARLRSQRT